PAVSKIVEDEFHGVARPKVAALQAPLLRAIVGHIVDRHSVRIQQIGKHLHRLYRILDRQARAADRSSRVGRSLEPGPVPCLLPVELLGRHDGKSHTRRLGLPSTSNCMNGSISWPAYAAGQSS